MFRNGKGVSQAYSQYRAKHRFDVNISNLTPFPPSSSQMPTTVLLW